MKKIKNSKLIILSIVLAISISKLAFAYSPLAESKYNKGLDFSEKGNYEMAIKNFESAIQLDPTFTDAYFNLGVIYEYLNQKNKAILAFEALLKQNPSDSETAYKLANLYYELGQYKKAMSYITLVSADSERYNESQNLYRKIVEKINAQKQKKVSLTRPAAPQVKNVLKNFQAPTGITKDNLGNLYVANYGDNSIIKITPNGQKALISRGNPINGPIGLAVDRSYNLYVANYAANNVLRIEPNGTISVIVKNIQKPYYLYIDPADTLYISEQGTNTIVNLKL